MTTPTTWSQSKVGTEYQSNIIHRPESILENQNIISIWAYQKVCCTPIYRRLSQLKLSKICKYWFYIQMYRLQQEQNGDFLQ